MDLKGEREIDRILTQWRKDPERQSLLEFLNDQVLREQELFWIRFAAFAALHAGLLALLAGTQPREPSWISLAGLSLGLLWILVQAASLWYASRLKDPYHDLREDMALLFSRRPVLYVASTVVGFLACVGVVGVWAYIRFQGR